MIHFEVIQSLDNNSLSPFKYFQNQIYLGRDHGDLCINDPSLNSSHLMLEVIGNELLVHPQRGVAFYLVNGKRASTIKKVKPRDEISIGKTILKIISFEETPFQHKKDILNQKLNQLVAQDLLRVSVIENLTKLMK